jgi:hypothetical protein
MKRSNHLLLSFLFLAPYLVGWSPADTSFDEYSVGLGGGQYTYQDCSGKAHSNSFSDAGVKVTHKFAAPFRVGVSASLITNNGNTVLFPYPDLALDFRYISLGTTGLRIGLEDGTYGEVSFLDQVPYFSGKGFARIGMGVKVKENTRVWLGLNSYPYLGSGIAGQVDVPLFTNHFLFINGRYGESGGLSEYGLSAGVRTRIY